MLKSTEGRDWFVEIFTNSWHGLVESWIGVAVRTCRLEYFAETVTRLLDQYASNRLHEAISKLEKLFAAELIGKYPFAIADSFARKAKSGVDSQGMIFRICLLRIVQQ